MDEKKDYKKDIYCTNDFSVYTVAELKQFCDRLGIEYKKSIRKAELIGLIEEHKANKQERAAEMTAEYAKNHNVKGKLCAYRMDTPTKQGKLTTGKVLRVYDDHYIIENVSMAVHKVPKERVMWFKHINWPRHIYNELKKIV